MEDGYAVVGKDSCKRLKEVRSCRGPVGYSILRTKSLMKKQKTEERNERNYI